MVRFPALRIALAAFAAAAALSLPTVSADGARSVGPAPTTSPHRSVTDTRTASPRRLPSFLVENTGWTRADARWVAKCDGYRAFLTDDGVILGIPERRTVRRGQGNVGRPVAGDDAVTPGAVVSMRFDGARRDAPFTRGETIPGRASFILGNDSTRWRSNLPLHAALRRPSLLSGVDADWRIEGDALRFDLRFAAGVDPAAAAMRFDGADEVRVTEAGGLVLRTGPGELRMSPPVAWHETPEGRRPVAAQFAVEGGRVTFAVPDRDPAFALVVDPTITYASYFGGNDGERFVGLATDGDGGVCVGGRTESLDLDVTPNAFQQTHAGGTGAAFPNDYFAARFTGDGQSLDWCTFIGGSGWDDAYGAASDASGAVWIAGETASSNAPTAAAAQATNAGGLSDGWIVKVAPGGNSLSWATYLGGSGQDEPLAVAVDPLGNALVTGWTGSTDIPLVGALQPTQRGASSDAFVTRIPAAGGAFSFSTFLGGNGLDQGNAITADADGNVYVTGWTNSTDFVVSSAVQAAYKPSTGNPPNDAFVTKLAADGGTVLWSTYYGGSGFDEAASIAVDAAGQAYVTGGTSSPDFPLRSPIQAARSGSDDMFALKFTAAGSSMAWATLLGGSGRDYGSAVGIDSSGNLCCVGFTSSSDFPLVNPVQGTFAGGGGAAYPSDTAIFRIRSDGTRLLASTYFGGSNFDDGLAMSVDSGDAILFCGYTASPDFPAQNGLSGSLGGSDEAFIGRLAPVIPRAPGSFAATSAADEPVQLSWTDSSGDETGFAVERRTGAGPWTVVKTVGAGVVAAQDAQIAASVTYDYRVRAVGPDGASSAPSNEMTVTTPASVPAPPPPGAPDDIAAAAISRTEIDIDWTDNASDETGFEVERREGASPFTQIALPGVNADFHADTTCRTGWSYEYRVRATGLAAASAFGTPARTATPGTMTVAVSKGRVTDAPRTKSDVSIASGTYGFTTASADGAWDPKKDGLDIHLGGVGGGVTLSIPPGDRGWKGKGARLSWKSPRGTPFPAALKLNLTKRTWSVNFSRLTFAEVPQRSVYVMFHSAGDGGTYSADWTERRPGNLIAPAPR